MGMLFFMTGLIIGSFLNVCIYRIPKEESVSFPPSHCGSCGANLRPLDLIPVISFLFLRRKCRYCGSRISWRYPGVELLTGVLFLSFYPIFGVTKTVIPYLFFISLLVVISFIDLDHYYIPDRLIILGLTVGTGFQLGMPFMKLTESLFGFFMGGGILLLIVWLSRGGMGGGDVKLCALIGFFLGPRLFLVGFLLAALCAAAAGICLMASKRKTRKDPVPFGPFLALGAWMSLLEGNNLLALYARYFFPN